MHRARVAATTAAWSDSGLTPSVLPRLPLYLLFLSISLLFLLVNLACALLVRMTAADPRTVVLVRVTINDTLFVLCAVSLAACLYKIAKMSLANIYLESKVRRTGERGEVAGRMDVAAIAE